MVSYLLIAGIVIIAWAMWRDRGEETKRQMEIRELKQTRDELLGARQEVSILLEQLETTSEKVVEQITARVSEIKLSAPAIVHEETNISEDNSVDIPLKVNLASESKPNFETGSTQSGVPSGDARILPKHQMVYAMANLGYSEEDIAKQMKIGKGEVNLMLQLKRKSEE